MRAAGLAVLALIGAACREPNPAFSGAPDVFDAAQGDLVERRDQARGDIAASPDGPRAPAVACPADRDLVACFRFEGAVKDESPSALAMTASGVGYETGPDGQCLSTRTGSRVRGPDVPFTLSRMTVEVWVRPRTIPAAGARATIVDHQRQFGLFILPGGGVRCRTATHILDAPGPLKAGVWSSVACTADGSALVLWIDGVMQARMPAGDLALGHFSGFAIGGNVTAGVEQDPDPFDGLMDNLRIWRRSRTAQELCAAAIGCRP